MTLRRSLIRTFDRPGGRGLLAAAVTLRAQRCAPGVRAYFQRGMWVHRERGAIFVDSPALDYHPSAFRLWANELERSLKVAADRWFHVYKPCPGDLIVDIGAGKGEETIAFSRAVGPAGRVIAIEAHPITFRCLRLFCELNCLDNVTPMNLAITSRSGPVAIDSTEEWQANRVVESSRNSTQVSGLTLDEVVKQARLTRGDFLKVNIEGGEIKAIEGMDRSLQMTRALCIACHDFRANRGDGEFFRTKAFIQETVERAGFHMVSRDRDPRLYVADQVNALCE